MPKLKPGDIAPTPEEDEAINRGIAADADNPELTEEFFQNALPVAERLTPEEIEDLRRDGKEASEYAMKAFADLRPISDMLTPEEIEDLRRDKQETLDYAAKAFADLRPTNGKKG